MVYVVAEVFTRSSPLEEHSNSFYLYGLGLQKNFQRNGFFNGAKAGGEGTHLEFAVDVVTRSRAVAGVRTRVAAKTSSARMENTRGGVGEIDAASKGIR